MLSGLYSPKAFSEAICIKMSIYGFNRMIGLPCSELKRTVTYFIVLRMNDQLRMESYFLYSANKCIGRDNAS